MIRTRATPGLPRSISGSESIFSSRRADRDLFRRIFRASGTTTPSRSLERGLSHEHQSPDELLALRRTRGPVRLAPLPLFGYMNDYLLPEREDGPRRKITAARGTVRPPRQSDIYGFAAARGRYLGTVACSAAHGSATPYVGALALHRAIATFLTRHRLRIHPRVGAALLLDDTLFEDGHGGLLSGPSTSPENQLSRRCKRTGRSAVYLAVSPTDGHQRSSAGF